jgi:hypothetical protein
MHATDKNRVVARRFPAAWGWEPDVKLVSKLMLGIVVVSTSPAHAEEKDPRPAAAIQDNSFLVEEAYNQEAGVVQHIGALRRQGRNWDFVFAQEWPLGSQTHQVSYTVPYQWLRSEGQRSQGFGEVLLNYRWQALSETATLPAIAPRFSLAIPAGRDAREAADNSLGWLFNLPVSKIVSDRTTLHFNAGMSSYFDDVRGQRPFSYFTGASVIYAITPEFNVMLEAVAEWNQSVDEFGVLERERQFTLSPGFRRAFNSPAGQLVVGAAAPVTFSQQQRPEYGALLYVSFEHSFLK